MSIAGIKISKNTNNLIELFSAYSWQINRIEEPKKVNGREVAMITFLRYNYPSFINKAVAGMDKDIENKEINQIVNKDRDLQMLIIDAKEEVAFDKHKEELFKKVTGALNEDVFESVSQKEKFRQSQEAVKNNDIKGAIQKIHQAWEGNESYAQLQKGIKARFKVLGFVSHTSSKDYTSKRARKNEEAFAL